MDAVERLAPTKARLSAIWVPVLDPATSPLPTDSCQIDMMPRAFSTSETARRMRRVQGGSLQSV